MAKRSVSGKTFQAVTGDSMLLMALRSSIFSLGGANLTEKRVVLWQPNFEVGGAEVVEYHMRVILFHPRCQE